MAPKRNVHNLSKKSVWEEVLIEEFFHDKKRREKMWKWLIDHPDAELADVPLDMWCVPKKTCQTVVQEYHKFTTKIVDKQESERGDCTKLLIELQDGHKVETVVMIHRAHATVCVSSQIGCKMGCKFCATGTMGIIGDLTSGEILEQLMHANSVHKIRNVVFMGMGEPLNNYDNVFRAVSAMVDTRRFALSPRQVTVSTVGVLKNMYRLSADLPSVNLALSLHAPNQETRLKIVPTGGQAHIDKLMEALDNHIQCSSFQDETASRRGANRSELSGTAAGDAEGEGEGEVEGEERYAASGVKLTTEEKKNEKKNYWSSFGHGKRKGKVTTVMIEYILIKNINASEEHAHELGQLLSSRRKHILLNLIPYNPTDVCEAYEPPTEEDVESFHKILVSEPHSIHTRIRQEKGQDIDGACGQLALVKMAQNTVTVSPASAGDAPSSSSLARVDDVDDIEDSMSPGPGKKLASIKRKTSGGSSNASAAVSNSNPFAFIRGSMCAAVQQFRLCPAAGWCRANMALVLLVASREGLSRIFKVL